jgi:hypothetical protein
MYSVNVASCATDAKFRVRNLLSELPPDQRPDLPDLEAEIKTATAGQELDDWEIRQLINDWEGRAKNRIRGELYR